jgi:hypothetical protein
LYVPVKEVGSALIAAVKAAPVAKYINYLSGLKKETTFQVGTF